MRAGTSWPRGISRRVCRGELRCSLPTGPASAGELSLSGKATATSGSYEIYYDASRRHHHLINPVSGFSPAVGSVSVVAGTAMEADILATALSILPPSDALKLVQGLPGREASAFSRQTVACTPRHVMGLLRLGTTAEPLLAGHMR